MATSIEATVPQFLPASDDADHTDGALRALGAIRLLEMRYGVGGAPFRIYEEAVLQMIANGEFSVNYVRACQLGASVSELTCEPCFDPLLRALPKNSRDDVESLAHDEGVLHVAAQLHALGAQIAPIRSKTTAADLRVGCADIEHKHRSRSRGNAPDDLKNFVDNATSTGQCASGQVQILTLDVGWFTARQDQGLWLARETELLTNLRAREHLAEVIVIGLSGEQALPVSWRYSCSATLWSGKQSRLNASDQRDHLPSEVRERLNSVFAFGFDVDAEEMRSFGVGAD